MILPCEIAAKSVVPAIKALLAKQLVDKQSLKQDQVAEILGISQSAVSKYTRKVRGYVVEIEHIQEVQPLIAKMIDLVTNGTYERSEFLRSFCQTCAIVRKTGIMCPFCLKADPTIDIEKCRFCFTYDGLHR